MGDISPRDHPSGALNFDDVAKARGKNWADQKLADVHRTERAQAATIVSLKHDVETARAAARAAEATAQELRLKLRSLTVAEASRSRGFMTELEAEPSAGPTRLQVLERRNAELEAVAQAASAAAEGERGVRTELEAAQAEIGHLRSKYDERLASSTTLQRSLEQELEASRAQAAAAKASAVSAATQSFRAERASAEREVADLRAANRRLLEDKAVLVRECEALQLRLAGLQGKITGVHQSISASGAQAAAEERNFAQVLRAMKTEAREHERADARADAARAEAEGRAAAQQRKTEVRGARHAAAAAPRNASSAVSGRADAAGPVRSSAVRVNNPRAAGGAAAAAAAALARATASSLEAADLGGVIQRGSVAKLQNKVKQVDAEARQARAQMEALRRRSRVG